MANRFVFPNQQWFDANGNPGSGWKLGFYKVGTSTRKDTYSDESLSTPNTNPVVADANGVWPDIYLDGTYDVRLLDANAVQKESWDSVEGPIFTGIGGGKDQIPTNAYVGAFVPQALDSGTDAYQSDLGRDFADREIANVDFGSANTTTTPTLENTGGTPGAKTLTTKDGSALWQGALNGEHRIQRDATADTWLVLDPNPSDSATETADDALATLQAFGINTSELSGTGIPGAIGRGAIVESGSNSNGSYVRWASGEQVCWTSLQINFAESRRCEGGWTFPASFSSAPIIPHAGFPDHTANTAPSVNQISVVSYQGITGSAVGAIFVNRINGQADFVSGDYVDIHVVAWGHWK